MKLCARIYLEHGDGCFERLHHISLLLNKLTIEFTKSCPRHFNVNALAESKNGTVIYKHLGYDHIPGRWAPWHMSFTDSTLIPTSTSIVLASFRFHTSTVIDSEGRVKKRYRYEEMKTPYDKLKSLPKADTFLKNGITFKQLDAIALAISNNEAVKQMNKAKHKLFKTIFEQDRKVG